MCYYIGIEDLAANALIELVEKTQKRDVSFKQLNKYGAAIIAKLKSNNTEAVLIFTREGTNAFFHDCSNYFIITEQDEDTIITLKEEVSTKVLRKQFRINLALDLLKVFISNDATCVLGIS